MTLSQFSDLRAALSQCKAITRLCTFTEPPSHQLLILCAAVWWRSAVSTWVLLAPRPPQPSLVAFVKEQSGSVFVASLGLGWE